MAKPYVIEPFDYASNDEAYERLLRFRNAMRKERLPDEDPYTLPEFMADFKNIPSFVVSKYWTALNPDRSEVVATAEASVYVNFGNNEHMADIYIDVAPAYRRQGIGKELLRLAAEFVKEKERRLVFMDTDSFIPAGEEFVKRLGAEMGLEFITNKLMIADLDMSLMDEWEAIGQREVDYELGLWGNRIPDDDLMDYIDIMKVMNTAPRGTLEWNDVEFTPEYIRQMEKGEEEGGTSKLVLYVRHKPSGKVVGYTEVYYHPSRPRRLGQGATGVVPGHRGHGLGKWLKGAMIKKAIATYPGLEYISTNNADVNAPMLKINNEMGFKYYKTFRVWQVPLDNILAYLNQGQV